MSCDENREYLTAYLDNELDAFQTIQIEKHLAECENCRRTRDEALALRSALLEADLYRHPSAEFAARVTAAVRNRAKQDARQTRGAWYQPLRWLPAAAGVVLVVALAAMVLTTRSPSSRQTVVASEALASHIRSLQASHIVDVPSSDRHTVKPWFQGKLDFSPPVPDLSEAGFLLAGGRLDYLDGHPVAALVYQRRKHDINVFLWPNRGSADDRIHEETAQGYQIVHWNGAAMNYWIVSDLNRAELLDFARALSSH